MLAALLGLRLDDVCAQAPTAAPQAVEPAATYGRIALPPPESDARSLRRKPRQKLIEQVIVTATKREADRRELPQSVDTFSGEELRAIGATDIESIARFSPGVATSPGAAPELVQVIIRGVAADTFINFFTRTFGLFYGDVSLINPSIIGPQPNLNPFDMNVEILKGPQGTLFGGSALAGAVRYLPIRPDDTMAYGKFSAGVGSLARSRDWSRRVDGLWNQPLGEGLALRLVASRNENPGYIDDRRSGEDDINASSSTQFRGLLDWQLADDLKLRLDFLHRDTRQDDGPLANSDERAEHSKRFYPDVAESKTTGLVLGGEWDVDFARVVGVFSLLKKDYPVEVDVSTFLGSSLVGVGATAGARGDSLQPSAELRLVSARASESSLWLLRDWDYVAGVFFQDSDQKAGASLSTQLTGQILGGEGTVKAREQALFFDLTRHLGPDWELGLGGRLFRQSTRADLRYSVTPVQGLAEVVPGLSLLQPLLDELPQQSRVPFGLDQGSIAETSFSPKLTLQWHYSQTGSIYAAVIKGFRYAGANQNLTRDPQIPLFFKSDHIWNYELGLRTRWLGGALQVDATAFQLEWTDFQIQQRDYTGIFAYLTNVGGARNRGVELSVDALLPAGVALRLNASYIEARTTTFFADFQGPAPAGSDLPGSPPFSGSALLVWTKGLTSAELATTLSYTYQNGNYNNLPHDYRHPPLGLLGAGASLRLLRWPGRPLLSLIATNLTNEFKPGVVFETPKSGGLLTVFNPPRTITLGVEWSLGGP